MPVYNYKHMYLSWSVLSERLLQMPKYKVEITFSKFLKKALFETQMSLPFCNPHSCWVPLGTQDLASKHNLLLDVNKQNYESTLNTGEWNLPVTFDTDDVGTW